MIRYNVCVVVVGFFTLVVRRSEWLACLRVGWALAAFSVLTVAWGATLRYYDSGQGIQTICFETNLQQSKCCMSERSDVF